LVKKRFLILSMLILFCFSTQNAFAYEKRPAKRLAILPIITCVPTEQSLQEILMHELKHELHVPLNDTLQAVEYIPAEEIASSMDELHYSSQDLLNDKKLQVLNEKLHADITVGIAITDLYEHRFYSSWKQAFTLQSGVSLHLIGYDRSNLQTIHVHASEAYMDEYSPAGELSTLTKTAVQELLQKAALKKLIFPLSKSSS